MLGMQAQMVQRDFALRAQQAVLEAELEDAEHAIRHHAELQEPPPQTAEPIYLIFWCAVMATVFGLVIAGVGQ